MTRRIRFRLRLGLPLLTAATVSAAIAPALWAATVIHQEDAKAIAAAILDDGQPKADREALIAKHPALSAALITAMTADMPADLKEEYRRIPWIWRVAIAAGRRNDPAELKAILAVALPKADQPLKDWQAVVIGGGLINGVSLVNVWPAERFAAIVKDDAELAARWRHALEIAANMADDATVHTGTRYDALRLLGVEPFETRGAQLARYLAKGVDPELQMGAISGLADVPAPQVGPLLISGWEQTNAENRELALNALLRDEGRVNALLDAVAADRIKPADLGPKRIAKLKDHPNAAIRARAGEVLK